MHNNRLTGFAPFGRSPVSRGDTLPHVRKNHGSCGVDVGINCLAALNDGTKYQPAKALKTFEDRLKRQQRILS